MVRIPDSDGAIYVEMNLRSGGAAVGVFWRGFDEAVKGATEYVDRVKYEISATLGGRDDLHVSGGDLTL